jgi:hypothetical protein
MRRCNLARANAVTRSKLGKRDWGTELHTLTTKFDRAIEQAITKFERAIKQAITDAYACGVRAGKRLAKGKSRSAKARGRPKVLDDIWALQFVRHVDSLINNRGVSLVGAVAQYLNVMAPVWKDLNERKPSNAALIRLYRRMKKGNHKIDARVGRAYEQLERDRSST